MMPCRFCENGISIAEYHDACHAEYERRVDRGHCPRCGKRRTANGNPWCSECNVMCYPPWVGFPPGGA